MDIRTKLVFALVAVSLGSMLALGAVAYSAASDLLRDNTLRRLDGLAEAKKQDLEKVIHGWKDRVNLIASRTQLRESLRDCNQAESLEQRDRIRRILRDARQSVQAVQLLTVYDVNRRPVASTATEEASELADLEASRLPGEGESISYEGVTFAGEDELRAGFIASLTLESEVIGALHVLLSARDLIDVTRDFTGLGDTGETLIVLADEAGIARILHPVRHRPDEGPGLICPERTDDPVTWAMQGEEGVFWEGLIDYRGEPVWAATRFLPEVGWGLVVKFDAAEERAPIIEFRQRLTRLALSLSAFAILLGTLLGLRFAKPIHDLAEVANRIRLGDLRARARPGAQDEIGVLARTFNDMAEELERRITTAPVGSEKPGTSGSGDRAQA